MKKLYIYKYIMALVAVMTATAANAQTVAQEQMAPRYAGGDISLMEMYEQAGARYLDYDGKAIGGSVLDFFKGEGMNIARVRLFVDPEAYTGSDKDPNACQSYGYILPLCKRIVAAGIPLMLDFHYSDTWADPAKQWTPAAWAALDDDALVAKIGEYTRSVLLDLKDEGVTPSFIQTGNEISYGMLWGAHDAPASQLKKCFMGSTANWDRLGRLLRAAGAACREVCPAAKIILHTERTQQPSVLDNFYTQMQNMGIDYDIIGLSYYPYFHGDLTVLSSALNRLETSFPGKDIMIVETGYAYKWAVPGTKYEYIDMWPYSGEGQQLFTTQLVDLCKQHPAVNGILWWWPEYNAYGTSLAGWYNAPLFDSTTGRALPAIRALSAYATPLGSIEGVEADASLSISDTRWYDLQGRAFATRPTLPGIYIHAAKKHLIID